MSKTQKKEKIESILRRKRELFKKQMKEVQITHPLVAFAYNLQTAIIGELLASDSKRLIKLQTGAALVSIDGSYAINIAKPKIDNAVTAFQAYIECLFAVAVMEEKHGISIPGDACEDRYNRETRKEND